MGETRRSARRARPAIESLELRQLLDAAAALAADAVQAQNHHKDEAVVPAPRPDRRISYRTPDGARVTVTLYGPGTLKGSFVRPDGALELVYNNTDNTTRIIGTSADAHGRIVNVPLAVVRDADTAVGNPSATGVAPIAALTLPTFRLIAGGFINLTGGVVQVNLKSMDRDSAIYLKEGVPVATATTTQSAIATGGASIGGISSVVSVQTTQTQVEGATGIEVRIDRITADPLTSGPNGQPFGDPQVFAVDPQAARLVRIDARTGQPTMAVPIPGLTDTAPPVGLAKPADRLLVLVGNNQQVLAFDAVSGASVGQFNTANLAGIGFTSVDGIGSSATHTILTDTGGVGVSIDVSASLASGQAVAIDGPIVPQREFVFNGDATGLAGSDVIYADGAAHFDTAQPNLFQFGVLGLAPFGRSVFEQTRIATPGGLGTPFINAGSNGLLPNPALGLGSVDTRLARLFPSGSKSSLVFYDPASNQAIVGTQAVDYTGTLTGLSESLHPELVGAALIDIQGNLRRYIGRQVEGLVLNTRGTVNLIAAHTAIDSAFIGRPLNHAQFVQRQNVQLISTARGDRGRLTRGGVTVDPNLPPTGPLILPRGRA
jgi:hypothetical protein